MRFLYLFDVYVHLLSAVILVGGGLFHLMFIGPILRGPDYQSVAGKIGAFVAKRWMIVRWHCLTLLTVTGFLALWYRGISPLDLFRGATYSNSYAHIAVTKIVVVILAVALNAFIDFSLAKEMRRLMSEGRMEEAKTYGARIQAVVRVIVVVGLILVMLGLLLTRGV
ncbi:MAG: hypothetical protein M5R36_01195 [Deltaproteobacteria bacterium]|nr:hypothetical protein [Deltaproteobacteria bacterium]